MTRGGPRKNAGRPKGLGKFGETTKPVRIPVSLVDKVMSFVNNRGYQLPLYSSSVQAGFPSPADDSLEGRLDLNEHLVQNPVATFFVRVAGDSMINCGIHSGDVLIVDRSIEAREGKIVVAAVNGELTVKRLHKGKKSLQLLPENDDYPPIEVTEDENIVIWGVVTSVIHQV